MTQNVTTELGKVRRRKMRKVTGTDSGEARQERDQKSRHFGISDLVLSWNI